MKKTLIIFLILIFSASGLGIGWQQTEAQEGNADNLRRGLSTFQGGKTDIIKDLLELGKNNRKYRPLEPILPGSGAEPTLQNYFDFFIDIIIVFAGVSSVLLIIWYGLQIMIGQESPAKLLSTKSRLFKVLIGVLILLTSYLALNFINPDLKILKSPATDETPSTQTP